MKARGRGSEACQALGCHAEIRTSLGQDSDAATGPSQARVRALGRAGREVALRAQRGPNWLAGNAVA